MELKLELITPGSQSIGTPEPHANWSKSLAGSTAGLVALLAAGTLPLNLDASLITHGLRTPGTANILNITRVVSSGEILQALANIHDVIASTSIDLEDAARSVLYEQLWNLYE
jgi:hypothetical protein